MITAVSIACGLLAIALVDFTGCRPLLLAGIALSAVFNPVVGGVGYHSPIPESDINVIVASLSFVVMGNKMSNNPFSFLITAELGGMKMPEEDHPNVIDGLLVMAISLAIDVIFAFILSYSVPYMITALGARVGFIFMAFCIAVLLGVFFFVPEPTGRSLEEVDELFERGLQTWQFKSAETTGIGHMLSELEAHRAATHKAHPTATGEVQDMAGDNGLEEDHLESV